MNIIFLKRIFNKFYLSVMSFHINTVYSNNDFNLIWVSVFKLNCADTFPSWAVGQLGS